MAFNLEKLAEIAKPRPAENIERENERKKNREWMRMSQDIALVIHRHLRTSNMTQREFASQLGVSPAYVAKLLKGQENLTLEIIWKIQQIIGISFFHSPFFYTIQEEESCYVAEQEL